MVKGVGEDKEKKKTVAEVTKARRAKVDPMVASSSVKEKGVTQAVTNPAAQTGGGSQ